jgi:hypothetical protein
MYRAQPVTRDQLPRAFAAVARLTQKIGIPMPKMYVIPTDSPNAFATGRNPQHASVAVTHGILQLLNDEELEGVLAHELGHVNNRDILISSVAATIAGAITWLRYGAYFGGMGDRDDRRGGGGFGALLMLILAPIAAGLIQMAVSRVRANIRRMPLARTSRKSVRLGKRLAENRRTLDVPRCKQVRRPRICSSSAIPGGQRRDVREPFLNASAGREANRAADGKAGGYMQ